MSGQRAQVAIEYLLLISLGLVLVIVGVGVALQVRELSNLVAVRTGLERNATLNMLVR